MIYTNYLLKGFPMKELLSKIATWMRHYKWTAFGTALCFATLIWVYGCESAVKSPVSDKMVGREVLQFEVGQEVARLQKELEIAVNDLDKQDEIKQAIFNLGLTVASGGQINPLGVAMGLAGILGIGTIADNREKDRLLAGATRLQT